MADKELHKIKTGTESELARLIKLASRDGSPVIVQVGEGEYAVYVEATARSSIKGTPRSGISVSPRRLLFSNYDATKAREELRRLEGSIPEEEAADMIEHIYRARREGSRPPERP